MLYDMHSRPSPKRFFPDFWSILHGARRSLVAPLGWLRAFSQS